MNLTGKILFQAGGRTAHSCSLAQRDRRDQFRCSKSAIINAIDDDRSLLVVDRTLIGRTVDRQGEGTDGCLSLCNDLDPIRLCCCAILRFDHEARPIGEIHGSLAVKGRSCRCLIRNISRNEQLRNILSGIHIQYDVRAGFRFCYCSADNRQRTRILILQCQRVQIQLRTACIKVILQRNGKRINILGFAIFRTNRKVIFCIGRNGHGQIRSNKGSSFGQRQLRRDVNEWRPYRQFQCDRIFTTCCGSLFYDAMPTFKLESKDTRFRGKCFCKVMLLVPKIIRCTLATSFKEVQVPLQGIAPLIGRKRIGTSLFRFMLKSVTD